MARFRASAKLAHAAEESPVDERPPSVGFGVGGASL
jgi:hypothetical protein